MAFTSRYRQSIKRLFMGPFLEGVEFDYFLQLKHLVPSKEFNSKLFAKLKMLIH